MTIFKPKGKSNFKHPILDFADRNLVLGLVLLPILFDWPAKAIQATVRTVKYGDPQLGSSPLAMQDEADTGTSGITLFGNLTRQGGAHDEGAQFPPRGDVYRDTSHLNSAKAGPIYGESGFYNDTRHMTPAKPSPQAGSEGGFLNARGKGPKPDTRPSYSSANQQLVDLVDNGTVFRGISGIGRRR